MESALRPTMTSAFAPVGHWNMSMFQRLLVGIAVLDTSIQVDTYLMFREEAAHLGAIGGINLSIATLCLVALYAIWLMEAGIAAGYAKYQRLYINLPLTAYIGIAALSIVVANDKLLSLNSLVLLAQSYLLYTYIANWAATREDVVYVVGLFAAALAIQGVVMIGLRVIGHSVSLGPIAATIGDDMRTAGTIGSPVTGGSFLALMFAPTLSLLVVRVRQSYKLLATVALGLGGIGLLLTQTRGSWIAVAFSVSMFFAMAWQRGWVSLKLPMFCLFAAIVFAAIFHDGITNRVLGDDEGSAGGRLPLFKMAWAMISDNPLSGVGINNCAASAVPYYSRAEFRGEWFWTIHNKYLLEWVETGFFGLAAFLLFLVTTIRKGWSVWRSYDRLLSPIALCLILAIGGQMVHMLVDVFSSRAQVQSLWLCAGLVAAIGRIKEDE